MRTRVAMLAAFGLLALPTTVLANAGTPLMITGMFYLVFGNALIGVAEGALLAKIFRLPYGRTIGLLVLANYFSAWIGGQFLRSAIVSNVSLDIYNAWSFFWIMVGATYAITLLLELPFVALALRKTPRWILKSLWGSLIVQTLSYTLIFGWYWSLSGTSLYTETQVVELSEMSFPDDVLLFYISADDGDVYQQALDGGSEERVFDLNSWRLDDRLLLRRERTDSDHQDLVARIVIDGKVEFVPMGRSFADEAVPILGEAYSRTPEGEGSWFNFGPAATLGDAKGSRWKYSSGFWPLEGLLIEHRDDSDFRDRISYETPFGHWVVRNVIHLPSDVALFQLGPDQVCVYDPKTRRLALVAKGRGPTAVLANEL